MFSLLMKYDSFGEFLEMHPKLNIGFILESGESGGGQILLLKIIMNVLESFYWKVVDVFFSKLKRQLDAAGAFRKGGAVYVFQISAQLTTTCFYQTLHTCF